MGRWSILGPTMSPSSPPKPLEHGLPRLTSRRSSLSLAAHRRMEISAPFNARLRDERLNGEIFYTLAEVRVVIGWSRYRYNKIHSRGALGYPPPAPDTIMPSFELTSRTGQFEH